MAVYRIFSARFDDRPQGPDEVVALRDGFSWLAALLPPVWALGHGLWLAFALYAAALAALWGAGLWLGAGAAFWLYVFGVLLLGFQAAAIRGAALARRGWRRGADIVAADAAQAELEWRRSAKP